jgi:hypothetical protein
MKLRLWPQRSRVEPEEIALEEPAESPALPPAAEPEPPAPPPEEEPPARLSLSLDGAKAAIREAKGDVIQVGFLAGVYRRDLEDDPRSAETAAARRRLCDLVATRLRDRKLLAADGISELLEERDVARR